MFDVAALDDWLRVLLLRDFNTRLVVLGTAMLGAAAGVVGSFTLLRKRALMGDALAHATLPGIALAFILTVAFGSDVKNLAVLLAGATVTGALGVGAILFLRGQTRLKEDTALGIVLSVFFGGGVALLKIVEQLGSGGAAGLEGFIYGKAASLVSRDVVVIAAVGAAAVGACALLFKEFKLLCFDAAYARTQGWPTLALDVAMMALVTAVTVVGLQAVGLILVIALLIIPAAAARFWTESLGRMAFIAAGVGAASGAAGALASAAAADLPSGATIVLVAAGLFLLSMLFGPARGVVPRALRRRRLDRRVARHHLLRAVYEHLERARPAGFSRQSDRPLKRADRRRESGGAHEEDFWRERTDAVLVTDLLRARSWSPKMLARIARRAARADLVDLDAGRLRLTSRGEAEARRVVRNHRLWELYLIEHADVAPSHVDRAADAIEHVLDPALVDSLERLLRQRDADAPPASPHAIPA